MKRVADKKDMVVCNGNGDLEIKVFADANTVWPNRQQLALMFGRDIKTIGANIAEGQYAQSKADFTTKYTIALKETSETRYWLELLCEAKYLPDVKNTQTLMADCNELLRLLTSSVKKLKQK